MKVEEVNVPNGSLLYLTVGLCEFLFVLYNGKKHIMRDLRAINGFLIMCARDVQGPDKSTCYKGYSNRRTSFNMVLLYI